MIQPQSEVLAIVGPHDPPHLLDMTAERLGEWTGTDADHYIRHIKPASQNVGSDQSLDFSVWLSKILNGLSLEIVGVLVRDAHKVVALACKLLDQIRTMRHARTENNGFPGPTINLVRLLDPLFHNVAS